MREIKFRYIFEYECNTVSFCLNIKEVENGVIQRVLKQIDEDLTKFTLVARDEAIGIPDCEGKEIYEGDIVEITTPDGDVLDVKDEIIFDNIYAAYWLRTRHVDICHLIELNFIFKIIGNIHEAH